MASRWDTNILYTCVSCQVVIYLSNSYICSVYQIWIYFTGTSVPPGTPLCSIENHTSYYTPMQPSVPCEEDSPYTTKSSAAIQETGSFQIIMDNLNMNQKTRHKTEDTSNKVHNLVHSMAVNDRATPTDPLDEIHPQADILSLSNELFIPSDNDIHHLNEDFKSLIQRALVDNIPGLSEYRQVVQYHILHEFSQQAEKKSTVVSLYNCTILHVTL